MQIVRGKCDCCNKQGVECMVIEKIVFWYFVAEVKVCTNCMSRGMKLLKHHR